MDAVDHPKALPMMRYSRIPVLILSFEEAIISAVRFHLRGRVGPEENAIRVANQKAPCRIGLPSEFANARINVDIKVRKAIEPLRDGR